MSTSIDGIGTAQAGVQKAPAATSASAASPATSFADTVAATDSGSSKSSGIEHDPRVILDPSAGFITQYLSANGSQVVAQSPSAITVAYLRLGLTADGETKAQAAAHATATA